MVSEQGPVSQAEREAAFAKYVVPEIEVLLRVAASITGNITDAEDAVQDTLIRAYRSIDRFDGQHTRAWLFTILRNAQRNRVRRRRPQLLDDPNRTEQAADTRETSPEEIVDSAGFDAEVEDAYLGLSEKHRDVVRLVDIDGLSYDEAAAALGVPSGTIMSRLHRARSAMKHSLESRGTFLRRRP